MIRNNLLVIAMKKICITGALGHIGSKLFRDLSVRYPSAEILLLDNLATQRFCSLFNAPSNCSFKQVDVVEADLFGFLEDAECVIHLAAITDAASSFDKADLVRRVNLEATKNVAEHCLRSGSRLLHLSSTSVYGTSDDQVDEDCPPENLKPQSPYAEAKLNEENWLATFSDQTGLKFNTYRFGTIAGVSPGMRFHTAVNKFCWQASYGLPITVWSTALNQKRPYLHLTDAVDAVFHWIDGNLQNGKIYNVLSSNHSVSSIIDMITKRIPKTKIELVNERIMNQLSYEVLDEKIRKSGFIPSHSIESAVEDTINLLKSA